VTNWDVNEGWAQGRAIKSKAWLLLAVGDDRQHGGNDGYDDEIDVQYRWDSTVPNHAALARGDRIVLWNKKHLLGASLVESISTDQEEKLVYRCPVCQRSGIKARKGLTPRYMCYKCKHEFDRPTALPQVVTTYRSVHDAAWVSLEGQLSGAELRSLCISPKSQLSLRLIDWDAFREALSESSNARRLEWLERRATSLPSGHRQVTVRVRLGQAAFRRHLLRSQGQICAFTGDAPPGVLEAGHLYSYADLGIHHSHGGLLLRRDIHKLFDDGLLAVHPETHLVSVAPMLRQFPQYATLQDRPLAVGLTEAQRQWLQQHWEKHRLQLDAGPALRSA
jgi:ribosomal protein L37AE/L43A